MANRNQSVLTIREMMRFAPDLGIWQKLPGLPIRNISLQ
jgi:hypothetical protein